MSSRFRVQRAAFGFLHLSIGILLATTTGQSRAQTPVPSHGEALYQQRCASCHDSGVARAPDTKAMRQLTS